MEIAGTAGAPLLSAEGREALGMVVSDNCILVFTGDGTPSWEQLWAPGSPYVGSDGRLRMTLQLAMPPLDE